MMERARRSLVTAVLGAVLASVVIALLAGGGALVIQRLNSQERTIDTLARQVKDLGGQPVVEPQPGKPGDPGPKGDKGDPGPKGDTGDRGVPGPIGKTGPPPACALLATACVGAAGAAGPKGDTGEPGPPGPKGEKGDTGEQGERGLQGVMGVQGNPGRGIAKSECRTEGVLPTKEVAWTLIYTDGTEETVAGSVCRAGAPDPPGGG